MQTSIGQAPGKFKVVLTERDDQSIRIALMHAIFEDKTNRVVLVTTRKKHIDNIISCYMQKHFTYHPFTITKLGGIENYELKDNKGKKIKLTSMKEFQKMKVSPEEKVIFLQSGKDKGVNLIESIEKLENNGNRVLVIGKPDDENDILVKVSERPGYQLLTVD